MDKKALCQKISRAFPKWCQGCLCIVNLFARSFCSYNVNSIGISCGWLNIIVAMLCCCLLYVVML